MKTGPVPTEATRVTRKATEARSRSRQRSYENVLEGYRNRLSSMVPSRTAFFLTPTPLVLEGNPNDPYRPR